MAEISNKPYLLRAIYEWCTDNGYTPYLAVAVDAQTQVPRQFVKNDEIVLNISFSATSGLKMENDYVYFNARFGGVSREIVVPVDNVMAIYARENGQGMAFEVVKKPAGAAAVPAETETPAAEAAPEAENAPEASPAETAEPPKKGGRPTLTIIK